MDKGGIWEAFEIINKNNEIKRYKLQYPITGFYQIYIKLNV